MIGGGRSPEPIAPQDLSDDINELFHGDPFVRVPIGDAPPMPHHRGEVVGGDDITEGGRAVRENLVLHLLRVKLFPEVLQRFYRQCAQRKLAKNLGARGGSLRSPDGPA